MFTFYTGNQIFKFNNLLSFFQFKILIEIQSRIEVVATDVTFLDGPANDNSSSAASTAPKNSKREEAITEIDDKPIDLSEIPF